MKTYSEKKEECIAALLDGGGSALDPTPFINDT